MKRLALLAGAETLIGLHGADYSDPQREAQVDWQSGAGETVSEVITLALKGGGQAALLTQIEAALSQAQSGGVPLSLYLERDDQSAALSSPILAGSLELAADLAERGRGYQGVRLRLKRRNAWDAPLTALPLSNANGTRLRSGLRLFNHCDQDGGHVNYADLAAADLPGCQPAPLLVRLLPGGSSPERLGRVLLACGMAPPALEGELAAPAAGLSTSLLADAGASNQAARRLSWSGATARLLLTWTLSSADLHGLAGTIVRPVLRLRQPAPAGAYLRWRLTCAPSGALWQQSALSALEQNHCLLPLTPFSVPGPAYLSGDPAALRLELWGAAAAGISASLDVDCLHLLPGGSFVQLEGAGGTAAGDTLVWDGCHGQVYSLNAAGEQDFSTHLLAGGRLYLLPNQANRLHLLFEGLDGAAAGLDERLVQVFSAERRRSL
jgi:hypothetical protein